RRRHTRFSRDWSSDVCSSDLLGTIAGGLLINMPGGDLWVAGGVLGVAVVGRVSSQFIPTAPPPAPDLPLSLDPIRPTWELVRLRSEERRVGEGRRARGGPSDG